jgi:glycosyltransferase involved in cell wall biosynthesis
MKILLGNNTLSMLAGSETWMLTLATQLVKMGHDVTAFSPDLGLIATKLEAMGVKCVKELVSENGVKAFDYVLDEDKSKFDVVICAHYQITKYIHSMLPSTPIIGVIHGIIHKNEQTGEIYPEHPVTEFKIDQYVAVSEEIQGILKQVYNIDSVIIRNFIDLDRFKKTKINPTPRKFLVNSNYWGVEDEINKIIKEVSVHYGAELYGIGVNFASTFEVEEIIKDVDIVIGMGRSVLEGIAMGKLGICHGRWGTGGVINPGNIFKIRERNFSGRSELPSTVLATSQELIEQIDKYYTQKNVDEVYKIVKKDHNAKIAAEQLIEIAKGLVKK